MVVAQWLYNQGYEVEVPPIRYAPSSAESMKYLDDGDIKARKDGGEWERIEVKGIKSDFTGMEDYPHRQVLVSNKKAIDRANPFPKAYYIVSKDLRYCAIVEGATRDKWFPIQLTPTTTVQLCRTLGGFTDNVFAPTGTPKIYSNGSLLTAGTNYSINTLTGLISFVVAPAIGVSLTWSGTYAWWCAWDNDALDVSNFSSGLYEVKKISFSTKVL